MIDPALAEVLESLQTRALEGEPREHLVATVEWAIGVEPTMADRLIPRAPRPQRPAPTVVNDAVRDDCEKPIRDEEGKFLGCEPGGGDGAAGGGGGGGSGGAGSNAGGSSDDDGYDDRAARSAASRKARESGVYREHPAAKKVSAHAAKAKQHAADAKAHFAAAGKAVLEHASVLDAHADELKDLGESMPWFNESLYDRLSEVEPVGVNASDFGEADVDPPPRAPTPMIDPPGGASDYASPKEREAAVDAFLARKKEAAEAMLAKIDQIEKANDPAVYKSANDLLKKSSQALKAHEKEADGAARAAESVDENESDDLLNESIPRPNADGEFASEEDGDAYSQAMAHIEAHAEDIQEEAESIGQGEGLDELDTDTAKEGIKSAKSGASALVSAAKRLRPLLKKELASLEKERKILLSDEDPPEEEDDEPEVEDEPAPEDEDGDDEE